MILTTQNENADERTGPEITRTSAPGSDADVCICACYKSKGQAAKWCLEEARPVRKEETHTHSPLRLRLKEAGGSFSVGDGSQACVGTKEHILEIIYTAYFWPGHLAGIAGADCTDGLFLVPPPPAFPSGLQH